MNYEHFEKRRLEKWKEVDRERDRIVLAGCREMPSESSLAAHHPSSQNPSPTQPPQSGPVVAQRLMVPARAMNISNAQTPDTERSTQSVSAIEMERIRLKRLQEKQEKEIQV